MSRQTRMKSSHGQSGSCVHRRLPHWLLLHRATFYISECSYYYEHQKSFIELCLQLFQSVSCRQRLENWCIVTGTLRTSVTSRTCFYFCAHIFACVSDVMCDVWVSSKVKKSLQKALLCLWALLFEMMWFYPKVWRDLHPSPLAALWSFGSVIHYPFPSSTYKPDKCNVNSQIKPNMFNYHFSLRAGVHTLIRDRLQLQRGKKHILMYECS